MTDLKKMSTGKKEETRDFDIMKNISIPSPQ